jgi:hypothetical protein
VWSCGRAVGQAARHGGGRGQGAQVAVGEDGAAGARAAGSQGRTGGERAGRGPCRRNRPGCLWRGAVWAGWDDGLGGGAWAGVAARVRRGCSLARAVAAKGGSAVAARSCPSSCWRRPRAELRRVARRCPRQWQTWTRWGKPQNALRRCLRLAPLDRDRMPSCETGSALSGPLIAAGGECMTCDWRGVARWLQARTEAAERVAAAEAAAEAARAEAARLVEVRAASRAQPSQSLPM